MFILWWIFLHNILSLVLSRRRSWATKNGHINYICFFSYCQWSISGRHVRNVFFVCSHREHRREGIHLKPQSVCRHNIQLMTLGCNATVFAVNQLAGVCLLETGRFVINWSPPQPGGLPLCGSFLGLTQLHLVPPIASNRLSNRSMQPTGRTFFRYTNIDTPAILPSNERTPDETKRLVIVRVHRIVWTNVTLKNPMISRTRSFQAKLSYAMYFIIIYIYVKILNCDGNNRQTRGVPDAEIYPK